MYVQYNKRVNEDQALFVQYNKRVNTDLNGTLSPFSSATSATNAIRGIMIKLRLMSYYRIRKVLIITKQMYIVKCL